MATFYWQGGSGEFTDPAHWTGGANGAIPGSGDVADLGNYDDAYSPEPNQEINDTIIFPTGTLNVAALNIGIETAILPGSLDIPAGVNATEIRVATEVAANQTLQNDGTITLLPGHLPSADSGGIYTAPNTIAAASGTATLQNNGTLDMELGSTLTLSGVAMVNDGLIDIKGGDLTTNAPIEGTGTIQVYDGTEDHPHVFYTIHSDLQLTSVGSGQTIELMPTSDGSTPHIQVALQAGFGGLVSGFLPGDSITLDGLVSNSVTYTPNTNGSGGVLTFTAEGPQGARNVTLRLADSAPGVQYTAVPDGNGNTVLTATYAGPALDEPSGETVSAGGSVQISGAYQDSFAAGNPGAMYLHISDKGGTLGATDTSGNPAAGSGTNNITLSTDYADVNAVLKNLEYTAGASGGSDTISFDIWNQAGVETTGSVPVAITSTGTGSGGGSGGSGPALSEPSSETISAGGSIVVSGSYTDSFAAGNPGAMYLRVSDSSGTLRALDASGNPAAGSGTGSITLSSTYADISAVLHSLTYIAAEDGGGSDTISFDIWNQAGVETTGSVAVAIGGAGSGSDSGEGNGSGPVLNEPSSETVAPLNSTSVHGSYSDSFAASNPGAMFLSISDSSGALSAADAAGNTVAGSGSNNITLNASYADVNAVLESLTYTSSAHPGSDIISFDIWNQAGVETTGSIPVTVTSGASASDMMLSRLATQPTGTLLSPSH